MAELLAALRALHNPQPALRVPVPFWLAVLASVLCDLAHFSPYSFGHLELMRRDNVPADNLLPALLGRPPLPVGAAPGTIRPRPRAPSALPGAADHASQASP